MTCLRIVVSADR